MNKKIAIVLSTILAALATVDACKKKDAEDNTPPPISKGKCIVAEYHGATVERQSCVLDGYTWECKHTPYQDECVRQGQQTAEDPAPAPPVAIPDAAPAVSDTPPPVDAK